MENAKPSPHSLERPLRDALLRSAPETGEVLHASLPTLAALTARGLARPHPRTQRHYLTDRGRRLRTELLTPTAPLTTRPVPAGPAAGAFVPANGDETHAVPNPDRPRHVATAWQGLLEIRRLNGTSGVCDIERRRMAWYVALALEAAGVPPSATTPVGHRARTGYRVTESREPGAVRVEWKGPASSTARTEAQQALRRVTDVLYAAGWQALLYLGKGNSPYLMVSPAS